MKKTNVVYWMLNGLFAFIMLGSAIPDILVSPVAVEGFKDMGMPLYLNPFLGYAKLLGVLAILTPGFPRLKEWAYAGLMFDLIGATWSIAASGIAFAQWAPMILIIALGAAAYIWHHKRRNAIIAKRKLHANNLLINEKAQIANAAVA